MASDRLVHLVNKRRRKSRCLAVRWDRERRRLVRCTFPWWHAKHSKYHCAERSTGKVWRVKYR